MKNCTCSGEKYATILNTNFANGRMSRIFQKIFVKFAKFVSFALIQLKNSITCEFYTNKFSSTEYPIQRIIYVYHHCPNNQF